MENQASSTNGTTHFKTSNGDNTVPGPCRGNASRPQSQSNLWVVPRVSFSPVLTALELKWWFPHNLLFFFLAIWYGQEACKAFVFRMFYTRTLLQALFSASTKSHVNTHSLLHETLLERPSSSARLLTPPPALGAVGRCVVNILWHMNSFPVCLELYVLTRLSVPQEFNALYFFKISKVPCGPRNVCWVTSSFIIMKEAFTFVLLSNMIQ